MNTKHTPGPWTVNANGINSPDGHIVYFDVSGGPHETDARLIAAAPDLLAALDALIVAIYEGKYVDPYSDVYRDALNARAKATKP
jgi:hypothetical protein